MEVSRDDVNEIMDLENTSRRNFDLPLSLGERLRVMLVEFNQAGRLLEVGVEFVSEDYAYVFHAQKVSPRYRKLYKERSPMGKKSIKRERASSNVRNEEQRCVDKPTSSSSTRTRSPVEKKFDLDRAMLNLGLEAHRRVVKTEVMKFRLEAKNLERLLTVAYQCNKPVGTLVREWVIEKLDEAEHSINPSAEKTAIGIIADSLAERGLLPDAEFAQIQQLLKPSKAKHHP